LLSFVAEPTSFAAEPTAQAQSARRQFLASVPPPSRDMDTDRHRKLSHLSVADQRTPQPQLSRLPKCVDSTLHPPSPRGRWAYSRPSQWHHIDANGASFARWGRKGEWFQGISLLVSESSIRWARPRRGRARSSRDERCAPYSGKVGRREPASEPRDRPDEVLSIRHKLRAKARGSIC
jgi:hypothetical protein